MRLRIFGRINQTALFLCLLVVGPTCISDRETTLLEPEEANIQILMAFTVHDLECNSSHSLIQPVFQKVNKTDVQLCVSQILSLECSIWNQPGDPTPPLCLMLQIEYQ